MNLIKPPLAALAVLLILACSSVLASEASLDNDPGGRILRVERWLKATLAHAPGSVDDAVREIDAWPNRDLQTLSVDEYVIAQLIRDPGQRAVRVLAVSPGFNPPRPKFPYNDWQMRRLRVLACAAAGMAVADPCRNPLRAMDKIDGTLQRLSDRVNAARKNGDNDFVLRRGAMLHGDVAMSSPGTLDPLNSAPAPAGASRFRVEMADGQPGAFGAAPIHWVLARTLLDALSRKPDEMTRQWYVATNMWMQGQQQHDTDHLSHAREMFPNDADLLLLSGSQLEAYASASIQSVVRSTSLPDGYSLKVPTESVALSGAEDFFKRALAQDPQMHEARIRLGQVLLARRRPQQAADVLKMVDATSQPSVLQYFHALLSGAADEGLGHFEQARDAYARAAALYPHAQSPHLALAALATRRGDRAAALKETQVVFDLPAAVRDAPDPWWAYYVTQARNTTLVFDEFYRRYAHD